jgi:hypothetical protein
MPTDEELRQTLDAVSHALRPVHKALMDLTSLDYEARHGRINGPVRLFQLVTQDPFFSWLHPMSALMAEIDELYDQKEPVDPADVKAVRATLEGLLGHRGQEPSPDSFVSRYLEILQNHPDVVMEHARLRKALDQL